jgi:hypothetical protein
MTETNAIDCSAAEGERRPHESSVQPAAVLDKLSRRIKKQAKEARELSKVVGKTDSDYYFGIAEGLDRAATQIRGEYVRAKALRVEHGSETRSAG